jgi:hypothetical protein
MGALIGEMLKRGAFLAGESLKPSSTRARVDASGRVEKGPYASSQARRVRLRKGRQEVIDGPFTESKGLIAGFCLMQLPTWEETLAFCSRFAGVLGGEVEMDPRPVE